MCCSVWTRKSSSRVASLEFTRSHAASRPDISSCFKISASRAGRSGCFSGPACKSMRSSLTKATPLPEPLCRPLASNQALVFQALACARVEVLWLDSAWDASGTTKWPEVRPGSGLMLRSCRSTAEHSWAQQRKRNQEIIDKSLWDTETRWYTLIYIDIHCFYPVTWVLLPFVASVTHEVMCSSMNMLGGCQRFQCCLSSASLICSWKHANMTKLQLSVR